jgi:hypothetical protein
MKTAFLDSQSYEPVELAECPSAGQQARVRRAYESMLLAGVHALLDRAERQPDYGFVDTKFSLVDGRDFDPADPLRGKATIYGWIQGRALEALAGHRAWLKRTPGISPELRHDLDVRLQMLLTRLVSNLEDLRRRNHGRLSFVMTREGQPLQIVDCRDVVRGDPQPDAPANFTDLFYAKGLAAAAASLGDQGTLQAARQLFDWVAREIENERFTSDQQQLDPGNPGVKSVPGRHPHSPRMIALGATALFSALTQDDVYRQMGMRFIGHVTRHYVNTDGQAPGAAAFGLWEYVDDHGRPYIEADGVLRSLPGHATEFVGLALKHLRVSGCAEPRLQGLLAQTLRANFQSGWAANGRGIVQGVDLLSGRVLNPNMPWWSLPETIRATMECRGFLPAAEWKPWAQMAVMCSNAFIRHYVRPEVHCMAIQTLDEAGRVAQVIPAVPDADPCYHTGLSVIDALEILETT